MPPDMNMVPPNSKEKKIENYNLNDKDMNSVEDILTGEKVTKKKITKNIKKRETSKKKLLDKILRTKASKILE